MKNNFSLVLVSNSYHSSKFKFTANNIKSKYKNFDFYTVVSENLALDSNIISEIKNICGSEVYDGGNTITSLLNKAFLSGESGWKIIIMEGSHVPFNLVKKISKFIESETDIIYNILPSRDRNNKIISLNKSILDCTLNGLTIHQETFKKIGKFSENPLEISRTLWSIEAIEKDCKIKGVLGLNLY